MGYASDALPQLGDDEAISILEEKKLGARIAREIYRDPDYIDDPVISAYVQRIWQPLLTAAKRRGDISAEQKQLPWEIMIGKDRSINAFALPGGYFGVHLGLIAAVNTRDELASVLAHELAHVSQRHIARRISKQNAQAPWVLGALILGALAASKNPQAASAVVTGSQAVSVQNQLNFSRDMEREADRIGFSILQEAGMDVRGFTGMFDRLQAANRINDNGSFPYLRSHPLTTERLGDMQSRLQLLPASPAPTLGQQAEHALIATRARLLADSSQDALRTELTQAAAALRNPLTQDASNSQRIRLAAQLYGGAFAALKVSDSANALRYAHAAREALNLKGFTTLAGIEYAQNAIELIVVEIALNLSQAAGQANVEPLHSAAQTALRRLAQGSPPTSLRGERGSLLAWAQLAQTGILPDSAGQRTQAMDALQTHLALQPRDALAWQALAALHEVQGQTLRSLRAQAEARVALLDYGAALDRLKAAQDWARSNNANHIDASIIDTRVRAMQALVREQALERDRP
ncbi:MAG: M48 family metalloprotease [Brachymonas sp.]|nr:M48 family metalloprotease [Brachymonas sp.]